MYRTQPFYEANKESASPSFVELAVELSHSADVRHRGYLSTTEVIVRRPLGRLERLLSKRPQHT